MIFSSFYGSVPFNDLKIREGRQEDTPIIKLYYHNDTKYFKLFDHPV